MKEPILDKTPSANAPSAKAPANTPWQEQSIQAYLFDLDGTLIDTAPDMLNALDALLDKYDLPHCDRKKARAKVSQGALALLQLGFGAALNQFNLSELRQTYLDIYANNLCADTRLFDGFEAVLTQFAQDPIPWGIVTNKPSFLTIPLLDALSKKHTVLRHRKCLVAADTLRTRKPHASGLLHAARYLEVPVPHIAYVGDSIVDIQAARAASMRSIAARYGYVESGNEADSWGADKQISKPTELLAIRTQVEQMH